MRPPAFFGPTVLRLILISEFKVCFGIIGCVPITPTKVPLDIRDLVPVFSKEPVILLNAQKVNEITPILYQERDASGQLRNLSPEETNFYEWTSQAIILVRQWLNQYKVPISGNSQKTLKLHISNAKIENCGLQCTILTLNVETADGIKRSFSVDMCAGGLNRSAGYSINLAVVELIRDSDILSYLGDR
jgi:hypothetical protein